MSTKLEIPAICFSSSQPYIDDKFRKYFMHYEIKSGKNEGDVLEPFKNKDGKYIVSKTRFKKDYVYVETVEQIKLYLEKGFKVRMAAKGISPSLVSSNSIRF